MSEQPLPPTSDGLEPINAAYLAKNELLGGWFWHTTFIWMSLGYVAYLVLKVMARSLGIYPHFAEMLVATLVIVWLGTKWRHSRREVQGPAWSRARNGLASDGRFRLRLIGEGATINAIATDIEAHGDQYAEPLITRTAVAISVADDRVQSDGSLRAGFRGTMSNSSQFILADLSIAQKLTGVIIAAACVGGLYFGASALLHISEPFTPFMAFTGVTAAFIVLGFLTPTYVRVSPGTLDILRFGWVARGTPRFERFDLKTCQILIDTRGGMIRLWDEERTTRRGIFINASMSGVGKHELSKAVLAAARSKIPAPNLPTDALLG